MARGGYTLPEEIRNAVIGENVVKDEDVEKLLEKFMKPVLKSDDYSLPNKHNNSSVFISLKKMPNKKWPKPPRHTRKTLSYKERRALGLYSVARDSLKYNDLLPLNSLWKDYMKKYINLKELQGKEQNKDNDDDDDGYLEAIGVKLFRADYHGAELLIKRSTCPGYVGKSGIVAMETKNCFVLVGKDNITRRIPKTSCEFSFVLEKLQFSFFGKNFVSRPADRSSKKIKTVYLPEL